MGLILKQTTKKFAESFSLTWILLGVFAFSASGFAMESASRSLNAMAFPRVAAEQEADEMVEAYWPYLKFVVEIGKSSNPEMTRKLITVFGNLKKRSPEGAARFLKGLRFEMMQKAELMSVSSSALSTQHPAMRKFVNRYMVEWVREADEHLLRSFSPQIARKD